MSDELIAAATAHNETDDAEILAAREAFSQLEQSFREQFAPEAQAVREAGGLFIIGTERHESRRIDNQLRGRSGRQGDPGRSRFYLAMTDDIMRLFGSERVMSMMEALKVDEDTPLDHKMLSNAIEQAQKTVESRHFQVRKSTLEYDDVMNLQRNTIYTQRRKVLDGENVRDNIMSMLDEVIADAAGSTPPENQAHLDELLAPLEKLFLTHGEIGWTPELTDEDLIRLLTE